jgi:hypothetical protein
MYVELVCSGDYLPFKKEATLSPTDFFRPSFTLIWPDDFFTSRTVLFCFLAAVMRDIR